MTETEFQSLAEQTLLKIERVLETAADAADLDLECNLNGNVLDIELIDSGTKIIVNSQAAMQEMWVAARSGGFHYRYDGNDWLNTRDDSELFATLSAMVSAQGGKPVKLIAG